MSLGGVWLRSLFFCIRHDHWKQLRAIGARDGKIAGLVLTPPLKHLVRVHSMQPSYLRNTRPRRQRLFDNPPLLLNCAPTTAALRTSSNQFRIPYDALLHTRIVYLFNHHVQTVETKRLHCRRHPIMNNHEHGPQKCNLRCTPQRIMPVDPNSTPQEQQCKAI